MVLNVNVGFLDRDYQCHGFLMVSITKSNVIDGFMLKVVQHQNLLIVLFTKFALIHLLEDKVRKSHLQ